jgi:hypothetical protein
METTKDKIRRRIQDLLNISNCEPDRKDFWKNLEAKMKEQERIMDELKELARSEKTLLGRTLRFPMADSYALYLITGMNKTRVQLKWLNYCDAWVDDRCGYACTMDIKYATQKVNGEDKLAELFSAQKIEVAPVAPIPDSAVEYMKKNGLA